MQNTTPHPSLELRSPASLRPYTGNARRHSKRQIQQIAESIKRFGFTNPVLIGDDDTIIAGHGRVAAAKLLGLEQVPTLRLSHLSEVERRAYMPSSNPAGSAKQMGKKKRQRAAATTDPPSRAARRHRPPYRIHPAAMSALPQAAWATTP